jgi:hypothetical protein
VFTETSAHTYGLSDQAVNCSILEAWSHLLHNLQYFGCLCISGSGEPCIRLSAFAHWIIKISRCDCQIKGCSDSHSDSHSGRNSGEVDESKDVSNVAVPFGGFCCASNGFQGVWCRHTAVRGLIFRIR